MFEKLFETLGLSGGTVLISAIIVFLVCLIAIKIISANLESVGGTKLKALFAKSARNTLLGVGSGTAATALVQSSGATSVMAIGFVSAGIIQAVSGNGLRKCRSASC